MGLAVEGVFCQYDVFVLLLLVQWYNYGILRYSSGSGHSPDGVGGNPSPSRFVSGGQPPPTRRSQVNTNNSNERACRCGGCRTESTNGKGLLWQVPPSGEAFPVRDLEQR